MGLYQFEAHLRLSHHGDLQTIMDSISSQPSVELKTLETMAGTHVHTVLYCMSEHKITVRHFPSTFDVDLYNFHFDLTYMSEQNVML